MRIGIDLGGSHIGIGVVQEGSLLEKQEVELTEEMIKNSNVKDYIEKYILEQIQELLQKYEIESIGVASPGTPKERKNY